LKQYVYVVMIILLFLGCGSDESKSTSKLAETFNPDYTGFIVHNRSQFELEHVYIYPANQLFQESINLIPEPLEVGELLLHKEFPGQYFVTVTRRVNETSELLAFTTTDSISLSVPIVVEYYDSEFRIYNIKVSTPTQVIAVESNVTFENNNTFLKENDV
jgi:hypothetical protein